MSTRDQNAGHGKAKGGREEERDQEQEGRKIETMDPNRERG